MDAIKPEISAHNRRPAGRSLRPPTPPLWQSYYHVAYTLLICLSGLLLTLRFLSAPRPAELLIVPIGILGANFIEYGVHRWPMHHGYRGLHALFRLHMVHHHYFYEDTYWIQGFRDFAMIVFPPVVLNVVCFGVTPLFAAGLAWVFNLNVALAFYATVFGYYLLMQLIHVLCHLDTDNKILALPGLRFLWRHHNIHHTKPIMAIANFNFIIPIADFVFGTAVTRTPADTNRAPMHQGLMSPSAAGSAKN